MVTTVINANPTVVELGTLDASTKQIPVEPIPAPQHCPLCFLFTKKGKVGRKLVSGAQAAQFYGVESFDSKYKWFNHSTVFANAFFGQANNVVIERIVPDDAATSSMILYLDVALMDIPQYQRNADGSFVTDSSGNKVQKTDGSGNPITAEGYKVRWVVQAHATDNDINANFGNLTTKTGSMTDKNGNASTMYPIMELVADSPGEYGNNAGIRLFEPKKDEIPANFIAKAKFYPYFIQVIQRADANASTKVVRTLTGGEKLMFSLKDQAVSPTTESVISLESIFLDSYENETDTKYPLSYSDYGKIKVYYNNIDTLVGLFHAKESATYDSSHPEWYDFTTNAADKHLFNIITGKSTTGFEYDTYQIDTSGGIVPGRYTDIWMQNGNDGTINDTIFAAKVSSIMDKYLDPNSEYMDTAVNLETVLYDSGFDINTKKKLANFIAVRKDTRVALSTFDATTGTVLTVAEEQSVATALKTRLQLFPESDYYGTPTMRGIVVAGTGKVRNNPYTKRVPQLLEIAIDSAKKMGASNRKWKNYEFASAPGSVIENLYDLEPKFIPANTTYAMWDIGMVWSRPYDTNRYFFPALQTVYDNDTSVLNNWLTVNAIGELQRIGWDAWRNFTGSIRYTQAQLKDRVEQFVRDKVKDAFDDLYVIEPVVEFTALDDLRGYSWTLHLKIYAGNMRTVMTSIVEAYRLDDLQQAA